MDKYCFFYSAYIYWKIIPNTIVKYVQDCPVGELAQYDADRLEAAAKSIRLRLEEQKKEGAQIAVFDIEITYFLGNGEFYSQEKIRAFIKTFLDGKINMQAAVDWIKELRTRGELPGLQGHWSNGHILINATSGYPCLIPAEEKE